MNPLALGILGGIAAAFFGGSRPSRRAAPPLMPGASSRTQQQRPRPPAARTQSPAAAAQSTEQLRIAREAALSLAAYITNRGTDRRVVSDLQRKMGVTPASGLVGHITAARARALGIQFPPFSAVPQQIRAR